MFEWLKKVFSKKAPEPKFQEVEKKLVLNKKSQNTIIRLRNGETRHLLRVSDTAQTTKNPFNGECVTQTVRPEIITIHGNYLYYFDDLGNRILLHAEDVQEIIAQPVVEMRDTYEVTIKVLEPIE